MRLYFFFFFSKVINPVHLIADHNEELVLAEAVSGFAASPDAATAVQQETAHVQRLLFASLRPYSAPLPDLPCATLLEGGRFNARGSCHC